ncbi:MAG: hypothetical protein QOH61_2791 [Chloroflexota bacterium]|nr:hypothetical protein [Chloroflexota bacterium]
MRRLLAFLLGNWPLKLGAVALATVLYAGVVLSGNVRTWPGQVPIDVFNPPRDAAVLDLLGYMTSISYRAPLDVASRLTNGSFKARVDLSNIQPSADGAAVEVPVDLNAVDASVQIVDYEPKVVRITLDPVMTRALPVTVDRGLVPDGLTIGAPQISPTSVTLTGAASRVSSVRTVVARVAIDASGLNIDQQVDLQALDEIGNPVAGVQLEPQRAHVRIDISRDQATVQLPVRVQLTGEPAPGFEVASVTVDPVSVTVSGEAPTVERLGGIATMPVDLGGRDAGFSLQVALDLPPEVTVDGATTVRVQVAFQIRQASRSIEVAVEVRGTRSDLIYDIARPSVLVTLSGPAAALDALQPGDVHALLQLFSLGEGVHQVPVEVDAPADLAVGTISPAEVTVDIRTAPHLTPSPEPVPTTSPGPG